MTMDHEPPKATNIVESIPNKHSYACPYFVAQFGERSDDDAIVVHIFVPSYTYEKLKSGQIKERFNQTKMQEVIEQAVTTTLYPRRLQVEGQYSSILDSFYLAIFQLALAPDPERIVRELLAEVERLAGQA